MVIVVTGPIASGKSTVARELARELERTPMRVAVIDLDLLYEMLAADSPKSDPATWTLARHAAAVLVNTFSEALRRAQSDPSRGLSRDPRFLGPYFAAVGRTLAAVPATDIVIDTERTTATSAASAIANRVRAGASN
jgi:uridine kinase